jgi:hypothetical protein
MKRHSSNPKNKWRHWYCEKKSKELDLYYFDESGFSLTPCIPYAWQPVGEVIEVPSSRSK